MAAGKLRLAASNLGIASTALRSATQKAPKRASEPVPGMHLLYSHCRPAFLLTQTCRKQRKPRQQMRREDREKLDVLSYLLLPSWEDRFCLYVAELSKFPFRKHG